MTKSWYEPYYMHKDDDPDDYDNDDYCDMCGGEGIIITCFDDICVGSGHCIHGDGEELCPNCGWKL